MNYRRLFEYWGFAPINSEAGIGENLHGDCLFCGKSDKLYLNPETGLWDCKVCGLKGNAYTFLKEIYEGFRFQEERFPWEELSENRGLPVYILKDAGLVYDWQQKRWILPVYTKQGNGLANLRSWKPGGKWLNSPGSESSLYGVEGLEDITRFESEVWICEGEWDCLALAYLTREANIPAIIIGVPGAEVFKKPWAEWLEHRTVILAYDNDSAGKSGKQRALEMLTGKAKAIYELVWEEGLPDKYDIRDFVRDGGNYQDLQALRKTVNESMETTLPTWKAAALPEISFQEMRDVFAENLRMFPDLEDCLAITTAVILSTALQGDPLWVYLIGVPGSGKTEILRAFGQYEGVNMQSSLTPHALISGWAGGGGRDASLLPLLNGKTLILKDFTEILQMIPATRNEVLSVLRGAYDGEAVRHFGNGQVRRINCHFSCLAATTPAIRKEKDASLGERFLSYQIRLSFEQQWGVLEEMSKGWDNQEERREKMVEAVIRFLKGVQGEYPKLPPKLDEIVRKQAIMTGVLRANVDRDSYTGELGTVPFMEIGSRVYSQLTKLGRVLSGIGLEINDVARLLRRVSLDSCHEMLLLVFMKLLQLQEWSYLKELTIEGWDSRSIRKQLDDLVSLKVISVKSGMNPGGKGGLTFQWQINPHYLQLWNDAFGKG